MNAATVSIIIEAHDKASSVMRSVERSGSALGNTLTTALGMGAAGVAMAGVSALTGALEGMGDSMIGANARLETATATFEAFTKDAGKAQDIVAALRKEAAITPFEQADMISAGKSLISVVKGDKDALMDMMKTAEVLAALNPAEGLEGAAFALKEATSGDFASVIERFNLSRSSINKFKEEGKTGIDAVRAALQEMGADSSLVDKLANTFEGRKSSVNDFFDEFKRVLGAGIFEKMSEGMAKTLDTLNESGPGLLEFASTMGSALGEAAGHVFAFTSKVTGALMQVFQGFQSGGAMGAAANIAMLLGFDEDAVGQVTERVQGIIDQVMGVVQGAIGTIQGATGTDVLSLLLGVDQDKASEIVGTWSGLFATLQGLAAGLQADLGAAVQSFGPALENLGAFAQNTLIPALQQIGTVIIGEILPTLIELGATIYANVIPTLVEVAGTIASTVIPILTGLAGFVLDNVVPAVQELGAAFRAWTDEILPLIEPAMQGVLTVVQTVMGAISAFWEEHWDTIATVLQAVWDVIKGQIEGSLTLISGIIKAALQILGGDWEGAWRTMETTVNTAFDQMMGGITRAMSSIGQLIRDGLAGIAAWAGGMAAEIGTAIWQGLQRAIDAGVGAVGAAARNLAQGAINSLNAVIDPGSPSRVTTELGESMVDGLMKALGDGGPEVAEAWRKYIGFILETGDHLNDWLTHLPAAWQGAGEMIGKYLAHVRKDGDYLNDWLTHLPDDLRSAAFEAGVSLAEALGHGWAESMAQFNPQTSFDFMDQRDFEHWQEQKKGMAALTSYTSGDPKVQADMRAALGASDRSGGTAPLLEEQNSILREVSQQLARLAPDIARGLRVERATAG